MTATRPLWRSLLYVPAHKERFVAGAAGRGADAIILDLEDGVPPASKAEARAELERAVPAVRAKGAAVIVRVNRPWSLAWPDLEAAVAAGANGVLFPKVDSGAQLQVLTDYLAELEAALGRDALAVVACIESAAGLMRLPEIVGATSRLTALIPGNEDLASDLRLRPERERFEHLLAPLLVAARAVGAMPIGTVGSSAGYADMSGYREVVEHARDWGFEGVTCIHPAQVSVANAVFAPSESAVAEARRVVEAFEAGDGGAVGLDGRMVDLPVYARAKRIVELASDAG